MHGLCLSGGRGQDSIGLKLGKCMAVITDWDRGQIALICSKYQMASPT